MVILFILGLACVAIAGMKTAEGLTVSMWAYLVIGIACIVIYLINLIRKKLER